jgi:importin subunit beta-1
MTNFPQAADLKISPGRLSQNFIRGALKYLVPLLTESLTKQVLFIIHSCSFLSKEDEPEEDTWNVAKASGTCLALVAQCVGDDVVGQVMPFITQNINNENWKFREAATLAFGAILEGPKSFLETLIQQVTNLVQKIDKLCRLCQFCCPT